MNSHNKKILLVEDDESNRLCLRDFLEHEGYICEEAANGAQGLKSLQLGNFDLIITDLNMPVMNGWQLLEALEKDPRLKHVPVLIVTGEDLPKTETLSTFPAVKTILRKPFDFPKIARTLTALFS
ncbi:MAG: response regulator [Nitrospirales bacterium]|nr:MAG: response regulator [Nitrospirales bacterium]